MIYRAWDGDFAAQRNFALTGAMVTGYFILMPTNGLQQGPSKRSLPSKGSAQPTITPSAGKILPSVIISIMGRSDRIGSCAFSQKRRSTGRERSTNTPFAPCLLRPFQKGWTIIPMRPLPIGGAKPASTRPFGPMMPTPRKRASYGKAASHALLGMLKVYLLQGGFLEGSMGIIATLQHGIYTAIKYAKLAEKNN